MKDGDWGDKIPFGKPCFLGAMLISFRESVAYVRCLLDN